jgi:mRNA interferase MazF
VARRYVPDHGDIAWLDFSPHAGHEQGGRRPALILSPKQYNGPSGMGVCCPITNRSKGYPFEVPLPSGLEVTGTILVDQVKSVDWATRRAKYVCAAPAEVVHEVLAKIAVLLSPGARN